MAAEKKWQVFFPRRGLDAILFIFPPPAFFPSLVCGKLFGWLRKASSASKTRLKDVFRGRGGGRSRQRREILAWWRRFRAISFLSITYSSRKDDDSSKKIPFLCFFFDSLILKCKEIRKAWINIHQRFSTPADLPLSAILEKIGVIFARGTFERFRIPYPAAAPLKVSPPSSLLDPLMQATGPGGRGFVAWKRKGEGGGGGGDLCVHPPEEMRRPTTVRSLLLLCECEEKISFLFLPLVWGR